MEVYCLEPADRYPMNAEYFRERGYWVKEREYGTRHYSQMFTIFDNNGEPWIEVRREPQSGDSSFTGFVRESCRLRLVNWACYQNDCIQRLRNFMILHDYIFKRIARIDICNDFVLFDSGDKPERFARRYFENKYSKINQCKVHSFANDGWASFAWESISWGSPKSMVGTKMYNKSKELKDGGNKKPYIQQAWFEAELLKSPLEEIDVWRVEFSMKSNIEGWLQIEDVSGKRVKKKVIPHTLSMFDSRDKLWQRFEDLAFHYFHFRYVERQCKVNSLSSIAMQKVWPDKDAPLKRKDTCRDKVLFHFNQDRDVYQIVSPSRVSEPIKDIERLRRLLYDLRARISDMEVRKAIDVLLKYIDQQRLIRHTDHGLLQELLQLQLAIASRYGGTYQQTLEEAKYLVKLRNEKEIW